jgi:heme exporter protein B
MEIAVSVLWSVHLISSLFSLIASQEWEWEANALRAVKLSGVEGHIVFLAKSLASILSMFLLWILEFLVWMALYGGDIIKPSTSGYTGSSTTAFLSMMILQVLLCGLLASIGISFIGQITSVLALHSRFRHVLMFIVFFPISIPVMIAASSYTRLAVQFKGWSAGLNFLSLEAAFCLFFAAAGVVLYDYLWEE